MWTYIRLWTYIHTNCEAFIVFSIIPASTIRLSQVMKCYDLLFAATYVWVAIIVNVHIKIMQRWMSESQFSVAKAEEDND